LGSADQLRKAIRRTRWKRRAVAIVLAFIATMIAIAPADAKDQPIKLALSGVMTLVSLWMTYEGFRAVDRDPLLRVLLDRPDEVAWIYTTRISRAGSGGNTWSYSNLQLGLVDGKTLILSVPKNDDSTYERAAAELAPRATVGFSAALQRQFTTAPSSLRRA
jgi:hypothetical protein